MSMGWNAARKLRRSVDGLSRVVAIEVLTAARALDLRRPLEPAAGTARGGRPAAVARRPGPRPRPLPVPGDRGHGLARPVRRRARRRRSQDRRTAVNERLPIHAATRHRADREVVADRGAAADADEQPRPRGGRAPGGPGRLRRHGQGGAQLAGVRRHRPHPARPRGRRDAARAVGQAGRRDAHPRVGAAGADRQLQPGRRLGQLGGVPQARGPRPDHVRPDDRRLVDLHRHAGHPAGHVRDVRGGGRQAVRRHPGRHDHADGRSRRHGRRAAAGRHHERRRGDLHRRATRRGSPGASSTATSTSRPTPSRTRSRGPSRRATSAARCRSACSATPPSCSRAAGAEGADRHRHRPDLGPRPAVVPAARASPSRTGTTPRRRRPGGVHQATPRRRWPRTCGRWWSSRTRAPRCSTTATRSATRRARAATTGRSSSRGSCRRTSGRSSARARARSAGPRCPATRPTSPRPTARSSSCSPTTTGCASGSRMAGERVHFQGLPARICWLGYGERHLAGLKFNEMVATGELKAPIVIGRDHLDCGSVASPYRETEAMLDGSDAIADWAILNALVNTASGATWVSFHHGGGVGIGRSLHAGQVCVADGTDAGRPEDRAGADQRPGHGRDPPRRRGLRPGGRGGRRARRTRPDVRGLSAAKTHVTRCLCDLPSPQALGKSHKHRVTSSTTPGSASGQAGSER